MPKSQVLRLYENAERPGVFVTRDGRVFHERPQYIDTSGYSVVSLQAVSGRSEKVRRHVLVAETFDGPRPPKAVVRHLDGDPANDDPINVCWGTQKENCQDTVRHGRSTTGAKNARAKLTDALVTELCQRLKAGESQKSVALDMGVSQPTVSDIKRGRAWRHIAERFGF